MLPFMALQRTSEEEILELESQLMETLNGQGGRAGNKTLMKVLSWTEDDYWPIRNRLLDQGRLELGRGKGGSVRVVPQKVPTLIDQVGYSEEQLVPEQIANSIARIRESDLYEPVAQVLQDAWAKDKRYRDILLEITARQGKRDTGGRWTRPDITIATMTTLIYVPGKIFDITTFEIKTSDSLDVTSVYEALAHRRAATRAYVWLHTPEPESVEDAVSAIVAEAKRHGVGVITGIDADDYDTWEEQVEAVRFEPDPINLDNFIKVQFSTGNKDELIKWMR